MLGLTPDVLTFEGLYPEESSTVDSRAGQRKQGEEAKGSSIMPTDRRADTLQKFSRAVTAMES